MLSMSKSIKTVVIDCDGVLTDGKVHYAHDGQKTKSFNSRDIRAIRQLISHGIDVIIVTQSEWPGINDYAERTGAIVIKTRDKSYEAVHDALDVYDFSTPGMYGHLEDYCMIGDDVPDIELMLNDKCVRAYCTFDADPSVRDHCQQLSTKGGEGVVAEVVRLLSIK